MDTMNEINALKTKLAQGRLSRRDFVRSALAVGVALPTALTLSDSVLAASPQRGGTLRQALTGGSTSDRLDPATFLDSYMINVGMGQLRNNLTELDENNQLIPELAESWDTSDGQNWVFNLRKGVGSQRRGRVHSAPSGRENQVRRQGHCRANQGDQSRR